MAGIRFLTGYSVVSDTFCQQVCEVSFRRAELMVVLPFWSEHNQFIFHHMHEQAHEVQVRVSLCYSLYHISSNSQLEINVSH